MIMITITAQGQRLHVAAPAIMAGSKNYITAHFNFSTHWDGTAKTAFFANGTTKRAVSLDVNNECDVPDVVVAKPGELAISVEGRNTQNVVLITSDILKLPIYPAGYNMGAGITRSAETQARLDRRTAAVNNAVNTTVIAEGNQLYIPPSACPYPWAEEEEPTAARITRERAFGSSLIIGV